MKSELVPTEVYDTYWRFAAERQAIYYRRLEDPDGPWTDDPILSEFRFTNAYRAADRVSQYLIKNVQYREDRSQHPDEIFFRTMLFKIFNKIETWESLEAEVGQISWQSFCPETISNVLGNLKKSGAAIYSAAYIMPAPPFGHKSKHDNHLAMIGQMMADRLPARLQAAKSLSEAYRLILAYGGLGPFLAFQYAIDLNYSTLMDFDEREFVVAGPGALDGISKCFEVRGKVDPQDVINDMVARQDEEFSRLGLDFKGLYGRRLQPIDCQNLFCEISKYSRVSHPGIVGVSGRTRIKQKYRSYPKADAIPYFPPKWDLNVPFFAPRARSSRSTGQLSLF